MILSIHEGFDIVLPKAHLLLAVIFAAAAATIGLTFFLPDNVYIRHQQARDSLMFHESWVYERINYDRAPIDVAIVGASHLEAAISPAVLSQALTASRGANVNVANLSLIKPGRDYTFTTIRNLLSRHSEVKVIVVANDGDSMFSHPMFKATADIEDIISAPKFVNIKYFENILYLPYRNISYFSQSRFPKAFGVRDKFVRSAYLGTALDRTKGYRAPTGDLVNGNLYMPEAKLLSESRAIATASAKGVQQYLHYLGPEMAQPGEWAYVNKIARLCREKHVKLVFVTIPIFHDMRRRQDQRYRTFGTLVSIDSVANNPAYYWNGGHLNRRGAVEASADLARQLEPLLRLE